jgi:hypothetical protein
MTFSASASLDDQHSNKAGQGKVQPPKRQVFQDEGAFSLSKHCAGAYSAHAILVQAAGAPGSLRAQRLQPSKNVKQLGAILPAPGTDNVSPAGLGLAAGLLCSPSTE